MNLTNNDDILRHIRDAADALAPADESEAAQLFTVPVEKASGDEWYLEGLEVQKKRRSFRPVFGFMTAVAALLVIVIFALPLWQIRADATIYLDVNPSLTISVDKNEKILDVTADNADGELILEGMDLKKVDLNVAINALIGSMVKNGYLSDAKNFILLTVEGEDPAKAEDLRLRLEEAIDQSMQSMVGSAAVFDQVADIDDAIEDMAEQYEMSPGKAWLIGQLTEAYPQLTYDDLAALSIEELYNRLKTEGVDLRSFLNYRGIDLDEDETTVEEIMDELEDDFDESDDDFDEPDIDDDGSDIDDDDQDVDYDEPEDDNDDWDDDNDDDDDDRDDDWDDDDDDD